MFLLQIQAWLAGWTATEIVVAIAGSIIGFAAIISAVKTIRTDGWQVFKDKWIAPWKARRAQRDAMTELVQTVATSCDTLGRQMAEVLKEVKPNGGSSLRDEVTKIHGKLENIQAYNQHQDETSSTPTFRLNENGKLVYANCAFRELINAEEGEIIHNNFLSLLDSNDRQQLIRDIADAVNYKIPIDSTVRYKTAGPRLLEVRMQATPDVRQGGVLRGFFGTACRVEITL